MSNNHNKIYLSSLFIHMTRTHIHTYTHTHTHAHVRYQNTYKIDIKLIYVLL